MQEIINLITNRTGITAAQAQSAIDIIFDQLKNKMPESVSGQVQNVLAGREFDFNQILKGEAQHKFENIKDAASEKFENIKEVASEKIEDLKDGAKGLMDKIGL